ncbi:MULTISPECIES: heparin/heparin-sulfate lyase HepB [unclassified Janthinobacterium]|uniref:heparin/heparin-sulfate lyase HepB n=1 Tax=unclassified Janthinobacterium TaxID=2610881 RepID=UPI00088D35F1|nr:MULTISPECIES: heparin/heparin-sulfate lyase HepB [unclassified Janthinobacterium]SDA74540.1 heparin/heparan-sulfate lyase [Janthinobacterium sp. 551a]SFB58580.1 heparin/heparan-sulfate lyase [Janthinobacterium sp. 344]
MSTLRCRNKLQGLIPIVLLAAGPALHAAPFPVEAMFEAEAAAGAPWVAESGGRNVVSGGTYLLAPADLARAESPGAAAQLSYTVAVPRDGSYTIWLRVLAPAAPAASLYLALDDGAYASVSVPFAAGSPAQWTWVPVTRWLAAGARELKLQYREGGLGIDCLLVTALADFVPQGYGVYPLPAVLPPPGEHPRLFARTGDLAAIRGRFESDAEEMATHRAVLQAFIQAPPVVALPVFLPGGSARTNHQIDVVSRIKAKALYSLLYERGLAAQALRGQEAVQMLLDYLAAVQFAPGYNQPNEKGEVILASAMVYDWCFNLMTAQQRAYVVTRFTQLAATMEIGFPPSRQGAVVGHGSDNQLLRDQLSAAIAFYDEAPLVYNIVAGRFFADYIAPRNYAYAAQAYQQGASYGTVRFLADMYAAWLFRRMGAVPVFDPVQQMLPYHWLYARRPDGQWMRDGDVYHSSYTNSRQYWSEPLAFMLPATYYNNSTLKHEYLKQSLQQSTSFIHPQDSIWPVLLGNTTMGSTPSPATLPLTKYFPDPAGLMIARTGWTDGERIQVQSGNVVATMKFGGDWFGNHEHYDAGHFQLYYKGGLAIDSGIYSGRDPADPATSLEYGSAHDMNYHKRTIAHNTMLVYDPDENFDGYANDGGQRFPGDEPESLAELANGYKVATVLRQQQVGSVAGAPDFSYIKGDLTAAYSSKVRQFQRSFVFVNFKEANHPAALIVFDKVSARDAGFKKTWLLHSQSEPEISGDTVVIRRTEWDYNSSYQYNGKLINRTVLPAHAVLAKVGGSGNAFSVGGTNYAIEPEAEYATEEAGAWRLEVSPAAASETDLFLNVMQVMDASSALPALPTTAIDSPLLAGVQIKDRVVLFSKSGMPLGGTVTVTLPAQSASLQVLVADLQEGTWTVRKRGTGGPIEDVVSAGGGTLYFVASAGGVYDLQRQQ